MAVDPYAVMAALKSFALARGRVRHAQVGEPKAPPQAHVSAAVLMEGIATPSSVLDAAVRLYTVTIRLYRGFLDDGEQTETELAQVTGALLTALDGDADLGGTVRNVDVAGEHSGGLAADWGYLEMDEGVMYRTVDITVPLIVDEDAGSLAP